MTTRGLASTTLALALIAGELGELILGEAQARRAFDALSEGGSVQMPLQKTFWSPAYGMVKDRFGVHWMVMVPGPCH